MTHRILIIDDEQLQTANIKKAIEASMKNIYVDTANTEEEIKQKISETYFNIALVDLRMDNFSINGFDIINEIIELNPFSKIIISSAFLSEYSDELNAIIKTGKISAILDKEKFAVFSKKIIEHLTEIINEFDNNDELTKVILESLYAEAKNEKDTFDKGKKFEYFVTALFSQMGFQEIMARTRDKSLNEIDLIIRNDVRDIFFNKFKPYFLVECKNEIDKIDKNQFIAFKEKLAHTNGLSNLGFMITPKGFKRTAYLEALRSSDKDFKIIFLSNFEINEIIRSTGNPIIALKKIIDYQVKDN